MSFSKFFSQYTLQRIPETETGVKKLNICPFCDEPNHFFANLDTGLWDCKKCSRAGNARGFITELYDTYIPYTTSEHCDILGEARNLSGRVIEKAGWAYDEWNDRWLIPYFNGGEFLANLGYFYPNNPNEKLRYKIFKAAGMDLYLYNPFHKEPTDHTYLCEGEWDALALQQILKTNDAIYSAPGSAVFKTEFIKTLAKATSITLMYDNDAPGLKGMARAAEKLAGKTVNILDWSLITPINTTLGYHNVKVTKEYEDPTDVRDFLTHRIPKPSLLINSAIVPCTMADATPVKRSAGYTSSLADIEPIDNLPEYFRRLRKALHISKETERAIILTLAVAISTSIDGEMIWVFLVGPPSCGKTTFIETFGGTNEHFDYASKLTAEALVSGYKTDDGSDSSMLPLLDGKTFFIKDFTVTISMVAEAQHKIFGILRDVYDGTVKIPFGNGQTKIYQGLNFNIIAGVTDAIHGHNDAELGERFLRIDYMGQNYTEDAILDKALSQVGKKSSNKDALTYATLGFVKHVLASYTPDDLPELTPEICKRIKCFAKLVARVRTKPKNDRSDGLVYKPRPEVATRLALQMAKLSIGVSRVLGLKEITPEVMDYMKKLTLDSCYGFVFDILSHIHNNPDISKAELIDHLGLPPSRVNRIINDLMAVKLIRKHKVNNGTGNRGRHKELYVLQPSIEELFAAL